MTVQLPDRLLDIIGVIARQGSWNTAVGGSVRTVGVGALVRRDFFLMFVHNSIALALQIITK